MSKFIIPICDIEAGTISNYVILARTIKDCEDNLMDRLIHKYDIDDTFDNYNDFVQTLDFNYDILIGEISDIETL